MEIFATHDWQKLFSKDTIRDGVDFFENCTIKEIEMRPDDIVVRYQGGDRSSFFALVDLEDDVLSARSSLPEDLRPAVGALLAVDEVIIEKQDALFAPETESDITDKQQCEATNDTCNPATKVLQLSFYISGQNLCFKAYWISNHRLVFPDNIKHRETALSQIEKDHVVKLIHWARKANFALLKQSKEYRMANLTAAIDFCRYTLPKWENIYAIQLDPSVQKLLLGIQEVHGYFLAEQTTPDAVNLSLKFSNESIAVEGNYAKKLLKNNGEPLFIEGLGAVRIAHNEINAIRDQQSAINRFKEVPRYMMYSIFSNAGAIYQDSEEIRAWKKSFASPPTRPFVLPRFLRSYQRDGVIWINHLLRYGFHGLVADDMGLGKTLQVLTFISKINTNEQTIVVCPASVVHVWKNEAAKFFPRLNVQIFDAESDINTPGVNVWVVSYTQLRRQKNKITGKEFQLAVLDEAQFIKNSTTKVFHACNAIRAHWRLALSGTPIENNLLDLWSIFRFLMPGLLGEKKQFLELCKSENITEKIRTQIAPFMLRRTKEVVAKELPQKLEINVHCEMTAKQQKLYKEVISNTVNRYRKGKDQFDVKNHRFGILSALTRLRQIACDPGLLPGEEFPIKDSGKLLLLNDILHREFLNPGRKVVIFSQFVRFLMRIKSFISQEFPDLRLFEIIGSTKNRNKIVDDFQNLNDSAVMLISLKAGGVGITLTAAETVFLMDPWWNPAAEQQAMDRVHRIGQEKNVTVYRLTTQNTIESGIQRLQDKKGTLFNEIINSLKPKSSYTEFFLDHLAELLKTE